MKLDKLGLKLQVPQTAAQTETENSALNESAYTYYSESVNQSQLHEDGNDHSAMESPDVRNIRADLEAEEEETKGVGRQIFTERSSDDKSTRKASLQIEMVDAEEKMA